MVRFNHNVVATILALATTPLGVVLATPPPDMIEALSAYAAAGVTPTIAAGIKDVHRLVRRVEADEETPRADPEEIVILPPPGHRPYVSFARLLTRSIRGGAGEKLTFGRPWMLTSGRSNFRTRSSAVLG